MKKVYYLTINNTIEYELEPEIRKWGVKSIGIIINSIDALEGEDLSKWRIYYPEWRIYYPEWQIYYPEWNEDLLDMDQVFIDTNAKAISWHIL